MGQHEGRSVDHWRNPGPDRGPVFGFVHQVDHRGGLPYLDLNLCSILTHTHSMPNGIKTITHNIKNTRKGSRTNEGRKEETNTATTSPTEDRHSCSQSNGLPHHVVRGVVVGAIQCDAIKSRSMESVTILNK